MLLEEAQRRSDNWSATLSITDPTDPFAGRSPELAGGLAAVYIWTYGHSVPLVVYSATWGNPEPAKQLKCTCGEHHGFPAGQGRMLFDLAHDDRWMPSFPIDVLDAMSRDLPR